VIWRSPVTSMENNRCWWSAKRLAIFLRRNWPVATNVSLGPDVSFRGEAEVGRTAESGASVENDSRPATSSMLV
jgi:hypothetical protein